jgi:type II secretory ATPase GspE/PulE/Tfp pilus assembly ATPase PilB-like protein
VKILSDIDIAQKQIVQEGHFSARIPGRRVDYRVSFVPTLFGQKLVIRILDTYHAPLYVKDLQLPSWMRQIMEEALGQEAGMLLASGPTGSGKTTSLYALLRSGDISQRNIVTIEDPVEIQLDGITQIPVNEDEGKTFSALLRSVLRQDPDAIMVGEIRDSETARIAMQAAITGHLVFSTVHTKDAVGTIFRLLDLGVEPYLVAQGLHLILAQRLTRKLCPHCKVPKPPTAQQREKMGSSAQGIDRIYVPRGCPRCLGTGYAGRRAFFELLAATDEIRDLITRGPTSSDVHKALAGTKFVGIEQAGYQLVAEGIAPFEEIERAIGADTRFGAK